MATHRLTALRSSFRPSVYRSSLIARIPSIRSYASDNVVNVQPPDYLDAGERKVFSLLKEGLKPSRLEVQDISGGCGSTYALDIVSEQFAGLTLLKQHRLVKKVLEEEMKGWHGIQLKTKAP